MAKIRGAGITANRTMTWPDHDAIVLTGGVGVTSLTAHGILLGNGTGVVTALAVGASSTVLIGNTGADPSFSASPTLTSLTLTGALVTGVGPHAMGTSVQASNQLIISGSLTGITEGINLQSTYTGIVNASNLSAMRFSPTFVEPASGTLALINGLRLDAPTVTAGGSAVTNTATLYIADAMTATVTGANYALWVVAGTSRFGSTMILDGGVLQFVGTTSSTPGLRSSGTVIKARLGDNSAYGTFDGKFSAEGTAGIPATVTTGDLVGKTMTFVDGILTAYA